MKNHIIYITTAMEENDFNEYVTHWKSAPNPSNQNFHNKLIRSLGINNEVDVISIRPFSRTLCDEKKFEKAVTCSKNITWHYLAISRNIFKKLINCRSQVKQLFNKLVRKDTIIFTDTINPSLIMFLKHANKKYNKKVVGVVTDSPSNISNTNKSYATFLLNNTSNFDAYICLTDELNDLYNKHQKPHIIIEGIVEEKKFENKINLNCPYFFFAGALLKRYGVYNLIDAFKEVHKLYPDYYLFIAGHHGNEDELLSAIGDNTNIRYLKTLPVKDVLYYEKNAVANINPRPFSEDLDRFSIPSKTIEYLVSGVPTISCKNTKLAKYFNQEIVWAKSCEPDDLKETMIKVITMPKEIKDDITIKGHNKVIELFGLIAVNKTINDFLFDVFN